MSTEFIDLLLSIGPLDKLIVTTETQHEGKREGSFSPTETELKIIYALRSLRFGSVEIVVHDGKVVQIERKEKVRLG